MYDIISSIIEEILIKNFIWLDTKTFLNDYQVKEKEHKLYRLSLTIICYRYNYLKLKILLLAFFLSFARISDIETLFWLWVLKW